ncbi:MAG: rRNA maturation RNase YbeY [Ignavibacteriaceae bacterium]|jgi:rRNA maturation RNase YbeY|nr:rRNA maturation RNase YbeY [Ignavibacteriaceae bacterium]
MNYINFFFDEIKVFKIPEDNIKNIISRIIEDSHNIVGEISVIFCTDNYLLELNKKYLKHDYFTDIITFNYSDGKIISGDLFISIDRVKENSVKFNVNFIDELARVVYHGILHLNGYDDSNPEEKQLMRLKEDYYLQNNSFDGSKNV